MGLSPGPIFVIRPLPWQVRLHGRSKKLIKKERVLVVRRGRQHGSFFLCAQGLLLRCVLCVLLPCFLYSALYLPACKSLSDSGRQQQQYSVTNEVCNKEVSDPPA